MSASINVEELFAQFSDFAAIKEAKLRFDELYEQAKQQQIVKIKEAAEQIDHVVVANGHDKPKRGRKPKHHDDK